MFKKLEKIKYNKRTIAKGIVFCQQTYSVSKVQTTNLYWLEISKNFCRFHLLNQLHKLPILEITKKFQSTNPNLEILAAINIGSFYLVDQGPKPKLHSYNLMVKDGLVCQLPSNNRPALVTSNGTLKTFLLNSTGSLIIGSKTIYWKGLNSKAETENTVYGIFDIPIYVKSQGYRKIRYTNRESAQINCSPKETLLGFRKIHNKIAVAGINQKLNLFDYFFIMKCSKNIAKNIQIGDRVNKIQIGRKIIATSDNWSSSIFSFKPSLKDSVLSIPKQIVPSQSGIHKPLNNDYRKSWSILLETIDNKIILFLNDARPKVKGQEGMNFKELHHLLKTKFKFQKGFCLDSGQTSKLVVRLNNKFRVFGNKHYLNFKYYPPKWDGINGRDIPSALIIYK